MFIDGVLLSISWLLATKEIHEYCRINKIESFNEKIDVPNRIGIPLPILLMLTIAWIICCFISKNYLSLLLLGAPFLICSVFNEYFTDGIYKDRK